MIRSNRKIAALLSIIAFIAFAAKASAGLPELTAARRALSDRPELVTVDVVDMFVPNGFDSNDEIIVVLDGYLPNSCYRLTRPEVKVNAAKGEIKITQMARRFPGPCIVPLVPFSNVVHIGALDAGSFEISTNNGMLTAKLTVENDTASGNFGPDDHLYAPVDNVFVAKNSDGQYEATIQGRFTNDCMEFNEVRVLHNGRVIELLPILNDHTGETCQQSEKPFSKKVLMPDNLLTGRNLVHVRSLNGNAINFVFSVAASF